MLKAKFLPFLEPLLVPIVVLPQKVSPDLMVHHPFNCIFCVPDWQSDNHCAHRIHVVVNHAGCRDRVFCKLVGKHFSDTQSVDVIFEFLCCFVNS